MSGWTTVVASPQSAQLGTKARTVAAHADQPVFLRRPMQEGGPTPYPSKHKKHIMDHNLAEANKIVLGPSALSSCCCGAFLPNNRASMQSQTGSVTIASPGKFSPAVEGRPMLLHNLGACFFEDVRKEPAGLAAETTCYGPHWDVTQNPLPSERSKSYGILLGLDHRGVRRTRKRSRLWHAIESRLSRRSWSHPNPDTARALEAPTPPSAFPTARRDM